MALTPRYIRWFSQVGAADVGTVGGKNASLGEMPGNLAPAGVKVPNGFAIAAQACRHVLDQADAWRGLHLLDSVRQCSGFADAGVRDAACA